MTEHKLTDEEYAEFCRIPARSGMQRSWINARIGRRLAVQEAAHLDELVERDREIEMLGNCECEGCAS